MKNFTFTIPSAKTRNYTGQLADSLWELKRIKDAVTKAWDEARQAALETGKDELEGSDCVVSMKPVTTLAYDAAKLDRYFKKRGISSKMFKTERESVRLTVKAL